MFSPNFKATICGNPEFMVGLRLLSAGEHVQVVWIKFDAGGLIVLTRCFDRRVVDNLNWLIFCHCNRNFQVNGIKSY